MAYQLTSNVEFDYSYSGSFAALSLQNVFSAFSVNYAPTSANIVLVTIGSVFASSNTINAGYYAHITDNPTATTTSSTAFDLGYTSQASQYSFYTTASGLKTTQATGGPSNANGGYGTLELGGSILTSSVGSSVNFSGIDNTLVLDTGTPNDVALLSSISNFQAAGDQIVINGDADVNAAITGYNNGVLTFSNGGVSTSIAIAGMASSVTAGNFAIGNFAAIEGGNANL